MVDAPLRLAELRSGGPIVITHASGEIVSTTAPGRHGAAPGGDLDPLTGLATRRRLIEYLDVKMVEATQAGTLPALILLDLDRFKRVNDSLGPLICDKLLCRVAARLRSVVPDAALLARVSGDGFAVVLDDGAKRHAVAERLLEFLGRPYAVSGHAITLGASLGLAAGGANGHDAHGLLHAADLAMHQAERDGRNRVRHFEPSMQQRALTRQALETDFRAAMALQQVELRRALVSQQFEVHYQPQVRLDNGQLAGFEALLRWRHPSRGLVSPDDFVPLAEEIGLIGLLGDWVLRTACRDAAAWPLGVDGKPLRVAVNISPLQLRDGRTLLAGIQRALDESGLSVDRLEIELTETALGGGDLGDTLTAIRRLGADLALDDFGTGYSSLSRLRTHPFNRLKIDRSFVSDLGREPDETGLHTGEWMVRAIASLGIGLGMQTTVEGIETEHQRDIARAAGCTEMQGYLVSRPVAGAAVSDLIDRLSPGPPSKVHAHGN